MWVWALFAPHPPVVIPQVGGSRRFVAEKTLFGFKCLQQRLGSLPIDHVLLLSPHFHYAEGFLLDGSERFEGNLASFGAPSVSLSVRGSPDEARRLALHLQGTVDVVPRRDLSSSLDHGSLVPLVMIPPLLSSQSSLVVANPAGLSPRESLLAGRRLRSLGGTGRWGLVASGDLSHCLSEEGPYGFRPEGRLFEEAAEKALSLSTPEPLLALSPDILRGAGHCGLNCLLLLLGLTGSLKSTVHSHEWPFGVGYLTASVSFVPPEPLLARRSMEFFLETGHLLGRAQAQAEFPLAELWEIPAAAFVSIKDQEGRLRGCMGTLEPQTPSVGEEILRNALTASCRDRRFPPLSASELSSCSLSVDILSPSEEICDLSDLDPRKWGVVVQWGERRGVLLPDLKGVDTVDDQIDIARRKAGIPPEAPLSISRFCVRRFTESQ